MKTTATAPKPVKTVAKPVKAAKPVKSTKQPTKTKPKESSAHAKAKSKALKAKKAVLKGVHQKRTRKVFTKPRFKKPKTLKLPRAPKYPRKSTPHRPR